MLQALLAASMTPDDAGATLAHLHRELHRIPTPSGQTDQRIVHLDLHPDNVVLTASGPQVIDWRNAREECRRWMSRRPR